jgi:hypothetical protein
MYHKLRLRKTKISICLAIKITFSSTNKYVAPLSYERVFSTNTNNIFLANKQYISIFIIQKFAKSDLADTTLLTKYFPELVPCI